VSGRVLLVGGTGFLGSFVARRLADRNPLVLVRPTSDSSVLPAKLERRVGDLDRAVDLHDVESVLYCASMGFGHVPPLVAQLEAAGVKRAIFVSTTAIFTSLPARSRAPRVQAEDAVRSSTFAWTILRPTMIYGTARDRNISRLLRFLKRSPVFPICGGDSLWQPVHVEDVADAVIAALDRPQAIGRAYNLAGAAPLTFRDLVRTGARAVGRRRIALVPVPLNAATLAARVTRIVRPEQIQRLAEDKAFDISAAVADLGYTPCSFAEGVRSEAHLLGLAPRGYDQKRG
jgi:nucleoside-diphosphate-sugar epimerase